MSKGLEALRRICLQLVAHDETQHKEFDEYVNAIEKELKALEIIKNKNVDIRGIKGTKNVHEYNVKFPTTLNEFLEEQEYDLLKKVLL